MTYADFQFYQDEYHGRDIAEEEFPRLALRASQYLDYITMGKAVGDSENTALKMACCAVADQYRLIDTIERVQIKSLAASMENAGREVQSETVGPWSKTFKSGGESAASAAGMLETANTQLAAVARQYLYPTGLLYRGGRCGQCSHTP